MTVVCGSRAGYARAARSSLLAVLLSLSLYGTCLSQPPPARIPAGLTMHLDSDGYLDSRTAAENLASYEHIVSLERQYGLTRIRTDIPPEVVAQVDNDMRISWQQANIIVYQKAFADARSHGVAPTAVALPIIPPHRIDFSAWLRLQERYYRGLAANFPEARTWQIGNELNARDIETRGVATLTHRYLQRVVKFLRVASSAIQKVTPGARFVVNVGGGLGRPNYGNTVSQWMSLFNAVTPYLNRRTTSLGLDFYPGEDSFVASRLGGLVAEVSARYGFSVVVPEIGISALGLPPGEQASYLMDELDALSGSSSSEVDVYMAQDICGKPDISPEEQAYGLLDGDGQLKSGSAHVLQSLGDLSGRHNADR